MCYHTKKTSLFKPSFKQLNLHESRIKVRYNIRKHAKHIRYVGISNNALDSVKHPI